MIGIEIAAPENAKRSGIEVDSVWLGIKAFGGDEGDVRRFVGDGAEEGVHVGRRVDSFAVEIDHGRREIAEFADDDRNVAWKFRVFNELRKKDFDFRALVAEFFSGAAILFALMPEDAADFGRAFGLLCLEDGVVVEKAAGLPVVYGRAAVRAGDETTLHIRVGVGVGFCE